MTKPLYSQTKENDVTTLDLGIGSRVRLLHDVDRFPHFIAPAGSVGTVVAAERELLPYCGPCAQLVKDEFPDVEVLLYAPRPLTGARS